MLLFKSGDAQAYRDARGKLKQGIKEARCVYEPCIEEHFKIQQIPLHVKSAYSAYRLQKHQHQHSNTDTSFPDVLNQFFNKQQAKLPPMLCHLRTYNHQVRSTLRKTHITKAVGRCSYQHISPLIAASYCPHPPQIQHHRPCAQEVSSAMLE